MLSDITSRKLFFLLFKRLSISDVTSRKALYVFMKVAKGQDNNESLLFLKVIRFFFIVQNALGKSLS